MKKLDSSLILAALVSAALISGCGGSPNNSAAADSGDISNSPTALAAYMKNLIAMDENSDAVDVNGVALVQDDTGDPFFPIV